MKRTRYFEEKVLQKRTYLRLDWIESALSTPVHREAQPDGRVRFWIYVDELGKYLRVGTLEDGATVHNAFPDRNFRPPSEDKT